MEFSVSSFANSLFDYILESRQFPYMHDEGRDKSKHPKREPLHLKKAIRDSKLITGDENSMTFDIGSEQLELSHPYYHILQNAPVIHKANRGTEKSKGSQARVEKAKRDYEKVSWNGKTFTKEYSRNVRGSRMSKATDYRYKGAVVIGGKVKYSVANGDSSSYVNSHYQYIDKILDTEVVDRLALEYGLKKGKKSDSGLGEEYALQEESKYTTNMLDIFESHNLGE